MHRVRKIAVSMATVVATLVLAAASSVKAADVMELAPLASLTPKAVTLGKLLANPLVPALLVSSLQQNLTASYCRLRSDKPLFWVVSADGESETIPVLPCSEGIAQFTLNHPGATRNSDGSVRLLAAEGRPDEMVVVFDQKDGYAAFALSSSEARRALAETRAGRRAVATQSGAPLMKVSIGEAAFASAAAAAAAVGTNHADIASQVAGLDAALSIGDAGIAVVADVLPKPGVTPEALCEGLEKSLGASLKAFGSAEGVRPVCKFTPSAGKVQVRLALSAAEMRKAGKAFNAAVVQAMSGEQTSGKKAPR